MVTIKFKPRNDKSKDYYTPLFQSVKISFDLPNDAGVEEYFEVFKVFLHSMGFLGTEDYSIIKEEDVEYDDDCKIFENCGEILTEKEKEELKEELIKSGIVSRKENDK